MIRYWYDIDADEYHTSMNQVEAEAFASRGYEEIDRIQFDLAMSALK